MTPRHPGTHERGAALLVAVTITAALSVVVGGVGLFAIVDVRIAEAGRDQAQAAAAADAALERAVAALATEPNLAAVRGGLVTASVNGASRLATADGDVDVDALGRGVTRARARLPPPWGATVWRPYLWGRLSEVLAAPTPIASDPLVVVWVRGDPPPDPEPGVDRLELRVDAVTPGHARAAATALVRRGRHGLSVEAVWPDTAPIDSP